MTTSDRLIACTLLVAASLSTGCSDGFKQVQVAEIVSVSRPPNLSTNPECVTAWDRLAEARTKVDAHASNWNEVVL